jgi:hypothetical protein
MTTPSVLLHSRAMAALYVVLSASCAMAQLPAARLLTVFPPGASANADVQVTISGTDLDDARELRFSHSGIHAQKARDAGGFTVHVDADVPVGTYDVRAIGAYGVSNPCAFAITAGPEVTDAKPHLRAAEALELPLGATATGRTTATADDWFRLSLHQGQRVLLECASRELDSRLEPVMTLFDGDQHELKYATRANLLDFQAPSDGAYFVKLHDLIYRGGAEYFYTLHAGPGPYIDFIFPPAGLPGSKSRYTLYGRNLPGGTSAGIMSADHEPLEKLEVDIDLPATAAEARRPATGPLSESKAATLDGIDYRLRSDRGISNPVTITFATAPLVIDAGGNEKPGSAQKLTVPCEVAGQFHPPDRRAWYTFDAKKGDVYRIEIYCNRLGSPSDPFLLVERAIKNDAGESKSADVQEVYSGDPRAGDLDFPTGSRDPQLRFEAKEDGKYRVQVRDLFTPPRPDPSITYRLAIRREQPDFRIVAMADAPPPARNKDRRVVIWNPFLRKGATVPIKVLVLRQDGFDGAIELHAEGLPGFVKCPPQHIPPGDSAASLLLSADENAADWIGPVRIVGKSTSALPVTHEAIAGAIVWGTADPLLPTRSRAAADLVLAVSSLEVEPLSIHAGIDGPSEISASSKIKLTFKVNRRGEFKSPMKLTAYGLPGPAAREVDLGPVDGGSYELDLAPFKLSPGIYNFSLQCLTQVKYLRGKEPAPKDVEAAFYSNSVTLKIKP